MHIVLVQIRVKPEELETFIQASMENARNSIQEPGIVRFDFLQQTDDPTQFTLVEVYRDPQDQQRHRETAHYQVWKDAVAGMMAEPRVGVKYKNLYPSDETWS